MNVLVRNSYILWNLYHNIRKSSVCVYVCAWTAPRQNARTILISGTNIKLIPGLYIFLVSVSQRWWSPFADVIDISPLLFAYLIPTVLIVFSINTSNLVHRQKLYFQSYILKIITHTQKKQWNIKVYISIGPRSKTYFCAIGINT